MDRQDVRMWSISFFVRPSLEIHVHRQTFFLRNQDPRTDRPCVAQNVSRRIELSFSLPDPYFPMISGNCSFVIPVVALRSPSMINSSCGGASFTAVHS